MFTLKLKPQLLQQNKITFSLVQYQILESSRLGNCPESCPWTLIGGLTPPAHDHLCYAQMKNHQPF